MANSKLQGSNISATEWYTGRCPARCELCFANLGIVGNGCTYGIYLPELAGLSQYDYAVGTTTLERLLKLPRKGMPLETAELFANLVSARAWKSLPGGEFGRGEAPFWFGRPTWNKKKRMLKMQRHVVIHPRDAKALYRIPKTPEAEWATRTKTTEIDGKEYPVILRVNTMSDSCLVPAEWLLHLRKVWGDDNLFFNCSVNAVKLDSSNVKTDIFHKVVMTTNPGRQSLAKLALRGDKGDLGHFYKPLTFTQLGYPQMEDRVKFYRVRTLPTISPKWDERGRTTVYTVLRFKSVSYVCEFARKYNCHLKFHGKANSLNTKVVQSYAEKVSSRRFSAVPTAKGEASEIHIWSNDRLNASPLKGQHTVLHWEGSWWRASKEQMDHLKYVCDRASNSCKACGLCFMLDGTRADGKNPVARGTGLRLRKYGKQTQYFEGPAKNPEFNEGDNDDDLYQLILRDLGVPRRNPSSDDNEMADKVAAALQEVLSYIGIGGEDNDVRPMDQWNTHEEVETILARCYQWLMQWSKSKGLDEDQAVEVAADFSERACGVDVFGLPLPELEEIRNGVYSPQ